MPKRADFVVVGAGHNGLVAAILLARAGRRVVVLDRSDKPGGAIRTEEVTLPGFRHDLYATNLNLFVGSRFFAENAADLATHGFEIVGSPRPFGSVFPDDRFVGVSTDPAESAASIGAVSEADAEAWAELGAWFGRVAPHLFPLLGTPMPSFAAARALMNGVRALGRQWPLELVRLTALSSREFVEEHFRSREAQALVAAWGMHLDFPPDIPGGALFAVLETFASASHGMAFAKGGADALPSALASLLRSLGGEVACGAAVERVLVRGGRAVGVSVAGGEDYEASEGVIANVTPRVLASLVGDSFPAEFRRQVGRYRYGPGTFMLHLALDELPSWRAGEHVRTWSYVHSAPYLDDMSLAYQQAVAGAIPQRPTLVIGQPTAVDPSRAPDGKHVLWIQARVFPGDATVWSEEQREVVADQILDLLEELAPGIHGHVLGRNAISPADLERANPNLVGGDHLGGSMHPAQHFFLRPVPGWSRYRTPVDGLYVCGAATWPGAGVGAGSGYLLGKQLTAKRRRRAA